MFIGSINRYMRAVLQTAAQAWKVLPVYVACSGNFTVERILARCGVGALIAFGDHKIDLCGLLAAIWAAAQTCFIRAGVANEVQKTAVP